MREKSQFTGCFLGLAVGDALGAPYEGGFIERQLWRLIGRTPRGKKRYTDDTQMSIDVARSFLKEGTLHQEPLAQAFASSYHWSRGYGPSAAKILNGISKGKSWRDLNRLRYREGSLGNGAAMRASVVALCHPRNDEALKEYVTKSAEITHAHPLAIEGAHLIAVATCLALEKAPNEKILVTLESRTESGIYRSKLKQVKEFCRGTSTVSPQAIRAGLGNGALAIDSCITAVFFSLRYRNLELQEMLRAIWRVGGDTDTIGAMAGGLWGAMNGDEQCSHLSRQIEGAALIQSLAQDLYQHYLSNKTG